jgi:FlaA1/EpsC-like NDP-sugar epimerase
MQFPRRAILFFDVLIALLSVVLAYFLRFNFHIPKTEIDLMWTAIAVFFLLRIIGFVTFKTYTNHIFYTSLNDGERIVKALVSGTAVLSVTNLVLNNYIGKYLMPHSVIVIEFLGTLVLMIGYRLFAKMTHLEKEKQDKPQHNIVVYGASQDAILTKNALERDADIYYHVVAYIDDSPQWTGQALQGAPVIKSADLADLFQKNDIKTLIIATRSIAKAEKQQLIEWCMEHDVTVRSVPPMQQWVNGELSARQIREVRIEDLLERNPIELDTEKIAAQITNKTVLVTGAAGSIGSEIARQLLHFKPKKLILLDQAETPLFELDLEFGARLHAKNYEVVIADVRNEARLRRVFEAYQPDIVYHAAAYKHVPMMENNPSEAILTNIKGTKILADLSVEYGVQTFVFVSTDKAVNPTNIMGASKRVAEIYVAALQEKLNKTIAISTQNKDTTLPNTTPENAAGSVFPLSNATLPNTTPENAAGSVFPPLGGQRGVKFITTRFGNVLGSNGSVIPLFKRQIAEGGPVTVTDPEMTRYFMTIPEACQLVLEAGAMGKGGEIFVFDMGASVKILDLAKNMIRLSGLELGKDIQIVFTGLRPGEKLYEELLNDQELTQPTHHNKILIAKVRENDFIFVAQNIAELLRLFDTQDNFAIVKIMKQLVPEYKSNNSEFEILDV